MSWLTDIWSGKRKQDDLAAKLEETKKRLAALEEMPVPQWQFSTQVIEKLTPEQLQAKAIPIVPTSLIGPDGVAMDSNPYDIKQAFSVNAQRLPDALANWYAGQGFIGYQMCGIIAQHWLVDKACCMPAEDACRNGWKFTMNDGTELTPEDEMRIRRLDVDFHVTKNLVDLVKFKRIFGVRVALFVVESDDPDYYFKPYNPDGIRPGSYKGISQVDPYWMSPEMGDDAISNPANIDFYEPTWWRIGGKRYHRSHLIVVRHSEPVDILKPSYLYGGISLSQQIYERVYAAERTANEAPMLAMTKRKNVVSTDTSKIFTDPESFRARLEAQAALMTNYAITVIGDEETYTQHETSLADLDAVIMSQYQLVAAIAEVPATKLLGTSPKGFNATGEHEIHSYHEMLAGLQAHDMTLLLERHYEILMRSEFDTDRKLEIVWNPLDEPTERELADINKTKADTYATLANTGAVDGQDIRDRIVADPQSGFSGIAPEAPEPEIDLGDFGVETPPESE